MPRLWIPLIIILVCGCADTKEDATPDPAPAETDVIAGDASGNQGDASSNQGDTAEPTPDAAEPTPDAAEPAPDADPTPDAGATPDADPTPDPADGVSDPAPEGCRSDAECAVSNSEFEMYCSTPYDLTGCGTPPMEQCSSNAQCAGIGPTGANLICHAVQDDCSPDGIGSMCDLACTNNPTMCGDEDILVCGDGGACTPRSCLDGFHCQAVQFCDPAVDSAGPHGCSFVSCQADADCGANLYCVKAMCIETLGTCAQDIPVP